MDKIKRNKIFKTPILVGGISFILLNIYLAIIEPGDISYFQHYVSVIFNMIFSFTMSVIPFLIMLVFSYVYYKNSFTIFKLI